MRTETKQRRLSDFAHGPEERTKDSIFGIVVDATCVYYRPQNNKYASVVKIVDQSWSQISHPKEFAPFVKVLFMSKTKAEVPHMKHIGSVIRFEGALLKLIEEEKRKILMFFWDAVTSSGKWLLSSETDNSTLTSTGAPQALSQAETQTLEELKKFSRFYLKEQMLMDLTQNLAAARAANKEFDAVCRVIRLSPPRPQSKGFVVYKLLDHTDKAYLHIPDSLAAEFAYIQPKDFVMLKGVQYLDLVERKIEMKEHGNVLTLPTKSAVVEDYRKLMNIFVEGMDLEEMVDEKRYMQPTEVSTTINAFLPLSPLRDAVGPRGLFGKKYRVKVYVVDMGPREVQDWVKGYCPICYKFFFLTEADEENRAKCRICKKDAKLVYQVQLFVKEKELRDTTTVSRLLLFTHNNKGTEFFDNEPPANCHRSERLCTKLRTMCRMLTHYNVYLDCVVERLTRDPNSFLQLVDTVVKFKQQ